MVWSFVHYVSHSMQHAHTFLDSILSLSKFGSDDVLKFFNFLKTNLSKYSTPKKFYCGTTEFPFQGLVIDSTLCNWIKRGKYGRLIESSLADVGSMNGEKTLITILGAQTIMVYGNTRIFNASSARFLQFSWMLCPVKKQPHKRRKDNKDKLSIWGVYCYECWN